MFEHQRHKPARALDRPRELVVVCAPLRSNVNFSRIARAAGCCGLQRLIGTGSPKLDLRIARESADCLQIETHRSLAPVLGDLRQAGYRLVGLEQSTGSIDIHVYEFQRRTALVVGNERTGLLPEQLALLDEVIELPVWGMPYSYNVATATAITLYEYCRQYPDG
ncbi:MAG: TrmH family RNA methyltransferase [Pirellulales bacterium]|nr:TrmH family RNA methyltransferase [Pirellulales bacterium]